MQCACIVYHHVSCKLIKKKSYSTLWPIWLHSRSTYILRKCKTIVVCVAASSHLQNRNKTNTLSIFIWYWGNNGCWPEWVDIYMFTKRYITDQFSLVFFTNREVNDEVIKILKLTKIVQQTPKRLSKQPKV